MERERAKESERSKGRWEKESEHGKQVDAVVSGGLGNRGTPLPLGGKQQQSWGAEDASNRTSRLGYEAGRRGREGRGCGV